MNQPPIRPEEKPHPESGATANADERWKFLRDVAVFQLKMVIDNLRDFALIPVSLGAALLDLFFKGEREGAFSTECSDGARTVKE